MELPALRTASGIASFPSVEELVDALSLALVDEMDRRYAAFKEAEREGMRRLLESPQGEGLRHQLVESGISVDRYCGDGDKDAPFYEGESGLRTFLLLGTNGRVQMESILSESGLLGLHLQLRDTWFQHGRFDRLTRIEKAMVGRMAKHRRATPLLVYREENSVRPLEVGQIYRPRVPRSWSLAEKAVVGDCTLVTNSWHGTAVSILSPYPGETEVVVFNPPGYRVTRVEERKWGHHPSRRVVWLEEVGKSDERNREVIEEAGG